MKNGIRLVLVAALIAVGWSVGRAQTSATDFELVVTREANGMDMAVQCLRGCKITTRQDSGSIDPKKGEKEAGWACGSNRQCNIFIAGWVQR